MSKRGSPGASTPGVMTSLPSRNTRYWQRTAASILLLGVVLVVASGAWQSRQQGSRREHGQPGDFDSYVLALSWAPAFCAQGGGDRTYRECEASRHIGFIVHGLWPQRTGGGTLEDCARVHPVSYAIVEDMLSIMPDRGLIQHEWRVHGSCSGMTQRDYFGVVKTAYSHIRVPRQFVMRGREIRTGPAEVEHLFQTASGSDNPASFRVACREGELTEVRICLSRNLQPIPCSNEVRECRAPSVMVRPIP